MAFAALPEHRFRAHHGYPHSCLADNTPALHTGLQREGKWTWTPVHQLIEIECVDKRKSPLGNNDLYFVKHNTTEGTVSPDLVCPLVVFFNPRTKEQSSLRSNPNDQSPFLGPESAVSNCTRVAILRVSGFWTEIAFIKGTQKCIGWVRSAYIRAE
jgi:hypothetical protein